jgi:hypothetical protein
VQSLHTITNFKDYRISKKFVAVINWIHSILPLMKEMRLNYIIYIYLRICRILAYCLG